MQQDMWKNGPEPEKDPGNYSMQNVCNRCGNGVSDLDAGFSPAAHGYHCPCGGKYVRYYWSDRAQRWVRRR